MTGPAIPRSSALLMTGQAPTHFIGGRPGRVRHGIDNAMAGDTLQSMGQMPLVREVDKIGEPLKPDPGHGSLLFPMFEQDPGFRGLRAKVLVASHAEAHGWDAGRAGLLGNPMAVETIDLKAPRVQFMAEAHRLRIRAGQVGASFRIEESDRAGQHSCSDQKGRRHPARLVHDATEEKMCCTASQRAYWCKMQTP